MRKIANTSELQQELRRLLTYTRTTRQPSRTILANELQTLSRRVARLPDEWLVYGRQAVVNNVLRKYGLKPLGVSRRRGTYTVVIDANLIRDIDEFLEDCESLGCKATPDDQEPDYDAARETGMEAQNELRGHPDDIW